MLITFLIKHSCFFSKQIFTVKIWSQSNFTVFIFLFGRVDFRIVADDASKIVKPRATQSLIV